MFYRVAFTWRHLTHLDDLRDYQVTRGRGEGAGKEGRKVRGQEGRKGEQRRKSGSKFKGNLRKENYCDEEREEE